MILCIGDYIQDFWTFGRSTRICPEAPVPVVVPETHHISAGGVGLVADQLQELGAEVYCWYGSMSKKTRIFAGSHLICRLDEDSVKDFEPDPFPDDQLRMCDCVVVSDYGKGAIFPEIAEEIIKSGKPLFVDAKTSWRWYDSPFATWFPNEWEFGDACRDLRTCNFPDIQIVEKRGSHGAKWGDREVSATVSDVVDTTGAGDIFLAGFVYANMLLRLTPGDCLEFANTLAGESCKHRGTYVVPKAYAQLILDTMGLSQELKQPIPSEDCDSTGVGDPPRGLFERLMRDGLRKFYSQTQDSSLRPADPEVRANKGWSAQTPHKSPSSPIVFDGEGIRALQSPLSPTDYAKTMEPLNQSPNAIERHNEHKLGQDLDQNLELPKPQV